MIRSTTIRNAAVAAALAGAGLVAAAAPSFAAGPGQSATATVTVNQEVSIAVTGSTSFALTPGVLDTNATQVTIYSNDNSGYTLSINDTGDPATGGGATFPSSDLTYALMSGSTQADACTGNGCPLSTTPALDLSTNHMSAQSGDVYSSNWLATLPSNVIPGTYSTNIVFTVAGK